MGVWVRGWERTVWDSCVPSTPALQKTVVMFAACLGTNEYFQVIFRHYHREVNIDGFTTERPLLTGHCGCLWSLSAWFSHSRDSCTSLLNIWHCFVCTFPCLCSTVFVCYGLFTYSIIVEELGCSSFLWTIGMWLWERLQLLLIGFSHSLWVRYYFFHLVSEKTKKQHMQGRRVVLSSEVRVWTHSVATPALSSLDHAVSRQY